MPMEVASLPDTGRVGLREYDATMGPPLEGPRRSPRLRAQEEKWEAAEAGMVIERNPRYPLITGPASLFACHLLAHFY
jgi:outer membrane protein TolC